MLVAGQWLAQDAEQQPGRLVRSGAVEQDVPRRAGEARPRAEGRRRPYGIFSGDELDVECRPTKQTAQCTQPTRRALRKVTDAVPIGDDVQDELVRARQAGQAGQHRHDAISRQAAGEAELDRLAGRARTALPAQQPEEGDRAKAQPVQRD